MQRLFPANAKDGGRDGLVRRRLLHAAEVASGIIQCMADAKPPTLRLTGVVESLMRPSVGSAADESD